MSFGIKIQNTDGGTVVDSETMSYSRLYSGSYEPAVLRSGVDINWPSTIIYYGDPITSSSPPLIAVRWDATSVYAASLIHLGEPGAWTGFRLLFDQVGTSITNTPADYRVYSIDFAASTGWGFRVKDAAGRVVMDAGTPILRVVHVIPPESWVYQGYSWATGGTTTHRYELPNPTTSSFFLASSLLFVGMGSPHGGQPERFTVRYGSPTASIIKMRLLELGETSPGQAATVDPEIYSPIICL